MTADARTVVVVATSPAVDRVALVSGARRGGVRRAREFLETAGGKGIHVAAVARALGADAQLVTVADARYRALVDVPAEVVEVPRVRGTYTVVDEIEADVIEVHEPYPELPASAAERLRERAVVAAAQADVVVVSGGVPPGLDSGLHAAVVAAARGLAVVDTSSVEALELAVAAGAGLVKPNLEEARALLGDGEPAALAAALRERGAHAVWLSLGAEGSVLATEAEVVALRPPPVDRVVNAVGAGDALLGGLVAGLVAGADLLAATRLGTAAAATKVGRLHPGEIDPGAARALAERVEVRRLG